MFFTKQPHPANFTFASAYDDGREQVRLGDRMQAFVVERFGGDLTCLSSPGTGLWEGNLCLEPCTPPATAATGSVEVDEAGTLTVRVGRQTILEGRFGVSGSASMFQFRNAAGLRFFGMGEKSFGRFELSGIRAKFWNTDVLGDFHGAQWWENPADPYYVSIPYLIVEQKGVFVGLLLETPFPTFVDTASNPFFFREGVTRDELSICLGAEDGQPRLWIVIGPTLAELTEKFTALTGRSERPPLWALGYHQSRWGYGGERDLLRLNRELKRHRIPCDGLWLDIDYMSGYRVFTVDKNMFPAGSAPICDQLAADHRRVVPILDPGVKQDREFDVYCSGSKAKVFALNPEGKEFVGIVWPGLTVFPDFSLEAGRQWWARQAADFRKQGFGAAWIDMNDPSTGAVDPNGMLFAEGKLPHAAFRNQYALGMQIASRQGFLKAFPNERPFLMSRSGCQGTPRHSALWTGDSVSNRFYLKTSIPMSLNMGLSGLSFHGHDVGGFMGDCPADLFLDWTKAHFLFPIFRVHSDRGSREQEPWSYDAKTRDIAAKFIKLRYRFLPYLYQLYLQHEQFGHPIIRPLLYHYADADSVDDQFLVGDRVLHAPFLDESPSRRVVLPGEFWLDLQTMRLAIDEFAGAKNHRDMTPLYFREGSIIPMSPAAVEGARMDLSDVEFHIVPGGMGTSETRYVFDDGLTYGYRDGKETAVTIQVSEDGNEIDVHANHDEDGAGRLKARFVVHGEHRILRVNGIERSMTRKKVDLVMPGATAKVSERLAL
ncbi:MAG: Oligosaccharide 4-alpha-D-glucosyltransferase [Fimbriimonadaceae bacterium]|nr:Oligosaccharide 4-alpha-D-glucosyltransferase [Fimbriimonadaceae bacterium]